MQRSMNRFLSFVVASAIALSALPAVSIAGHSVQPSIGRGLTPAHDHCFLTSGQTGVVSNDFCPGIQPTLQMPLLASWTGWTYINVSVTASAGGYVVCSAWAVDSTGHATTSAPSWGWVPGPSSGTTTTTIPLAVYVPNAGGLGLTCDMSHKSSVNIVNYW
jgi:hypothetical protein